MRAATAHIQNSRRDWRHYVGPVFFAATIFYILFHAFSGDRGIYALFKETRKLGVLQVELATVGAKRTALEHRVRLMNSSSLDFDLLDEQARSVLSLTGADEIIYYPSQP